MVNAKLKIDGHAISCATKNLTPEGVFIITRKELAIGDDIALSFTLPQSTISPAGQRQGRSESS